MLKINISGDSAKRPSVLHFILKKDGKNSIWLNNHGILIGKSILKRFLKLVELLYLVDAY